MPTSQPPAENQLGRETSPYLLQHAHNPVHWRGWGPAALAEARATNRPIMLSIGYAACHWCHVMAHESFEDPDTAAVMNTLFVNIKVDREERPDIDHLYMSALQALGEQGGWPLTMFLTPDGDPFWGGTYFPPEPRWGRPSFRQVLHGVAESFHAQSDAIGRNVDALRRMLAATAAAHPGDLPGPALLDHAAGALLRMTDPVQGGMRGAPKFPNPPIFRFLWQNSFRTGAPEGIAATTLLLNRMSQGGIYDHLGGGYARYATDADWLVPHFEKMLYDNAQILELLALAHADAPDPLYRRPCRRNRGVDDPRHDGGDHRRPRRLRRVGGRGQRGRGGQILRLDRSRNRRAARRRTAPPSRPPTTSPPPATGKATPSSSASPSPATPHMRRCWQAAAPSCSPPARNASARAATTRCWPTGTASPSPPCAAPPASSSARTGSSAPPQAFDFIRAHMSTGDGRIQHAWRLGRTTAAGLLDDQAAMARAALALFEATGDAARLDQARALATAADTWFADDGASYFVTASDAPDVPFGAEGRPRTPADNATPAGNGVMAEVLARLYHLTGEPHWRTRAEAVLTAFAGLGNSLSAAPTLLAASDLLENAATIVIAGAPDAPQTQALLATALAAPDPAICVLRAPTPDAVPIGHPAHGKTATNSTAAAYICRGGTCGLPIADPAELALRVRQRTQA